MKLWAKDRYYELEHRMECVQCGTVFDPIKHRWLCPNPECKHKNSCCEGEPL